MGSGRALTLVGVPGGMLASLRETPSNCECAFVRVLVNMDEVFSDEHHFGRIFYSRTWMYAQVSS